MDLAGQHLEVHELSHDSNACGQIAGKLYRDDRLLPCRSSHPQTCGQQRRKRSSKAFESGHSLELLCAKAWCQNRKSFALAHSHEFVSMFFPVISVS